MHILYEMLSTSRENLIRKTFEIIKKYNIQFQFSRQYKVPLDIYTIMTDDYIKICKKTPVTR